MEVWLVAPGEVTDSWNKRRNAGYKGWVKGNDVLFFPHVETCCALILFGDKFIVGGHMSLSLPEPHYDPEGESPKNGRYVWQQVAADYTRLNSRKPLLMTIGPLNWYTKEVPTIIQAVKPLGTRLLKTTWEFPAGVDVWAYKDTVLVQKHVDQINGPIHTASARHYALPVVNQNPGVEEIAAFK